MQADGDRLFGFVRPSLSDFNCLPRNLKNLFEIMKAGNPRSAIGGDPHRRSKQISAVFMHEYDGFVSNDGEIAMGSASVSGDGMGCIASQISPFLIFTCFVERAVRAENPPHIETGALNDLSFSWAVFVAKSLTGGCVEGRKRSGNESILRQFLRQFLTGFMGGQQREALSGRPHRSKISGRFPSSGWRAVEIDCGRFVETGKTAGLHLVAPIVERNDWNWRLLNGLIRWSGEQATSRQICRIDKSESLFGDLEQLVWVEWLIGRRRCTSSSDEKVRWRSRRTSPAIRRPARRSCCFAHRHHRRHLTHVGDSSAHDQFSTQLSDEWAGRSCWDGLVFEGRQDGVNLGKAVPSISISVNNSAWRWLSVQILEAWQTHDREVDHESPGRSQALESVVFEMTSTRRGR